MSDDDIGVAGADPSLSAAVLIGVSQYRSDFPPVPQAERCVRLLAQEFAAPDLWGLRRHVGSVELVDPDRATVLEAVGRAAQVVRSPGILVIYFVGHAERYGEQLCLAVTDSDRSRPDKSMVTVSDLVDEVKRNGRRDIATLLLLDCCYAGHAAQTLRLAAVRAAESAGWYLLGAADSGTPADAAQGGETTRFTGALLHVLNGVPDKGPSLRGHDVFDALTHLLPNTPPVHSDTPAGLRPWVANRRYVPPPSQPLAFPSWSKASAAIASPRRPRMVPPLQPDMVDRPELRRALIDSLRDSSGKSVVVTAVRGTGGFGKTTLVTQACHDPAIDELFPGGILWTELGQHIEGPELASKINDLTEQLTGVRPTLSGPQEAGFRLGEALDACQQPVLLVVDDVWRDEQVQPFLLGGKRCRRVVTTRANLPSLAFATPVPIDLMSDAQAKTVITRGVADLPDELVFQLLRLTGRWPLLLNITNRTIARLARPPRSVLDAARMVADRLDKAGPAALDTPLAFGSKQRRTEMVAACLNASLDALPAFVRDRYLELGIFAEDTDIPYATLALLWSESGGLDFFQTEQLGQTLIDASLATPAGDQLGLRLHDVLRSYVREVVAEDRRTHINSLLVTAASRLLPARGEDSGIRPWWALPDDQEYLWQHLTDHLIDAGRDDEVTTLLVDLRWIAARIRRFGPVHAEADLERSPHPDAPALSQAIRHNAHLLTPIKPEHAIDDILASRLDGSSRLQPHVTAFTRTLAHRPRLANRWPPPDQPDPALRRAIHTGHPDGVESLHIAPDSTWFATTGRGGDPTVHIWDTTTGARRHRINTGHPNGVETLHIASDGTWLATTGSRGDPIVRIFDTETGVQRHRINTGHPNGVQTLHIAPDSTWFATTGGADDSDSGARGDDPTVRIWDAASGALRHRIDTGHSISVRTLHIAPDGTWLATTGHFDSVVRVWDADTAALRHHIDTGHPNGVWTLHIAPDGSWFATAGNGDPVVRIWDAKTGTLRHTINTGHPNGVWTLHIAPDGTWLATIGGSGDPTVHIWDAETGAQRHRITIGHPNGVWTLHIAPDSSWLATTGPVDYSRGSGDPIVRTWDTNAVTQGQRINTDDRPSVEVLRIARAGTWLASSGDGDPVLRIWDTKSGARRSRIITGHPGGVETLHIAPDDTWLATTGSSHDRMVHIWNAETGARRLRINTGHPKGVRTLHIAPDGTWFATTGSGEDPIVYIWDTETGALRYRIDTGHPHGVWKLHIAPDGTWLATTGPANAFLRDDPDPLVHIWDTTSGTLRHTINTGHRHGVWKLHIAPDGTWLATTGPAGILLRGDPDPFLFIWDATTGTLRHRIDTGHRRGIEIVHIAPDGTWLATTGPSNAFLRNDPDPFVHIWDTTTGTLRHRINTSHANGIRTLHIAPDGTWLATTGASGILLRDSAHPVVRIWDSTTGTLRSRIDTGLANGIRALHVAPDGTWFAAVSDTAIAVCAVVDNAVAALRVDGTIGPVVLSASEKVIFAGGTRGLYAFNVVLD